MFPAQQSTIFFGSDKMNNVFRAIKCNKRYYCTTVNEVQTAMLLFMAVSFGIFALQNILQKSWDLFFIR